MSAPARQPRLTPHDNAAIRRGVAAVVSPAVSHCPRCGRRFRRRLIPGTLNLSDRDIELIDAAREFTLKQVAAVRPVPAAGWIVGWVRRILRGLYA